MADAYGGIPVLMLGPTASIKLRKGDALLEPETDVHFGSNDTKKPVVILVAALLAQGAPLATPIGSPGG